MSQRTQIDPVRKSGEGPHADTKAYVLLIGFLIIALITGGGSRPDVQSHVILRPAAVLLGAYACLQINGESWRSARTPIVFLLILAAIMLLQLVPLPPALWTSLPGRELYASGAGALGLEQGWHALTLSPAQTRNSLVALLPPLAALLLFAVMPPSRRASIVTALLVLLGASAILGIAQRAGPPNGILYLYRVTNETSAVGFFANRNHQAALLACMFPMLATFASLSIHDERLQRYRAWLAFGGAVVLVPLILATGSRSGLALALIGIVLSGILYRRHSVAADRSGRKHGRWRRIRIWLVIGTAVAAMAAITLLLSQAEAINRFLGGDLASDLRVRVLGNLVKMSIDAFPVGIGFGAFEPVYRAVELPAMLDRSYLNNAHNDLMQWVIEGGLPGVLLLAAFLYWLTRRSLAVWSRSIRMGTSIQLARLGTAIIFMLLLASLVDYPLRTPFVMIVFGIAAAWLASADTAAPSPAA